jgi:hypothetical protein
MEIQVNKALTAFIDTNILLHYKPLSQIDWCGIFNAQTVTLMICMPVIDELDGKKSDQRLAERAKRAIKEIKEYSVASTPLRPGVTLEIYKEELRRDEIPEGVNPDGQDGQIVGLVRKYQDAHPDSGVCLVSEDFGMNVRCAAGGVSTQELDEVYRLENPGDENAKKLKQTQSELAALKNRLPRLSIQVATIGQSHVGDAQFACVLTDDWTDVDPEAAVEKQRGQYPKHADMRQANSLPRYRNFSSSVTDTLINPEEWQRYDREIDSYLVKYKVYVDLLNIWGSTNARTARFDLWLSNNGNSPATDIDLYLNISSKFGWIAELEAGALMKPQVPSPPMRPIPFSRMRSLDYSTPISLNRVPEFFPANSRGAPEVSVHLRPNDNHIIHAKLERLKHEHSMLIGTFLMVFVNWEVVSPFEVEYSISCAECPEKTSGKLPMIVTKAKDTSKRD